MPTVRDLLDRFRPAGAPGAAAVAVPADRRAVLAAELEPVFALLTGVEDDRRRIADEAETGARAARAAARERAAVLVEEARREAAAVRAAARAAVERSAAEDRRALMAAARDEAARVEAVAAARSPELVGRAVRAVDVLLGGGTASPGEEA
ncbi:hypothetical protein [Actinomadura chibensis]|uniref:Uncharacterized protein n=1 Tax=Actinomadura chibensis TaxID=392828 RepID=A0A5D0N740_9ACTN|nr:hypothetical protein [Actinomadura chibensis]TYB40151.1 hypothetical protein FXF69_39890 [Actinomadura chibensis]